MSVATPKEMDLKIIAVGNHGYAMADSVSEAIRIAKQYSREGEIRVCLCDIEAYVDDVTGHIVHGKHFKPILIDTVDYK